MISFHCMKLCQYIRQQNEQNSLHRLHRINNDELSSISVVTEDPCKCE